jgi:hypothetical protein
MRHTHGNHHCTTRRILAFLRTLSFLLLFYRCRAHVCAATHPKSASIFCRCFSGTGMQPSTADSFWRNSDVLNYLLTATPLAVFLPLCYKKVCQKMISDNQKESIQVRAASADAVAVASAAALPSFVSKNKNTRVIFNRSIGPAILAGITYHVTDIDDQRINFKVALHPDGTPLTVTVTATADAATATATFQATPDYLCHAAILRCMPVAHPNLDVPSLLDTYFDYHMPLSNLMCHLENECDFSHESTMTSLDVDKKWFGPMKTSRNQVTDSSLLRRFCWERGVFIRQLSNLFGLLRDTPALPDCQAIPVCCLDPAFSIDSSAARHSSAVYPKTPKSALLGRPMFAALARGGQAVASCEQSVDDRVDSATRAGPEVSDSVTRARPEVWVGLSQVQSIHSQSCVVKFRKPVAFKAKKPADSSRMQEFEELMRTLKPGSYIASASKESKQFDLMTFSGGDGTPSARQRVAFSATSQQVSKWVSEAGICTLHDLFKQPIAEIERKSLAFRDLLKEVVPADLFQCGSIMIAVCCRFCRVWRLAYRSCMNAASFTTTFPQSTSRRAFINKESTFP